MGNWNGRSIVLNHPSEYEYKLFSEGRVIADWKKRYLLIKIGIIIKKELVLLDDLKKIFSQKEYFENFEHFEKIAKDLDNSSALRFLLKEGSLEYLEELIKCHEGESGKDEDGKFDLRLELERLREFAENLMVRGLL